MTETHYSDQLQKAVTDTNEDLIKETKSTTKAIESLSQPKISFSNPTSKLTFDHKVISSDFIDELVEIMTLKNTIQFRLIPDENSTPKHSITVTGIPFLKLKKNYGVSN